MVVCGFHAVCAHLLLCLSVNHTHFLAVGLPSLGATSVLHILCAGREHKGITILQQLKWLFTERKNFHRRYEQASTQSKYMPADFLFPNKPIPFCPTLGDSIDSMQAVVFWRGGVQKPRSECLPVWGGLILTSLDLNQLIWYLTPFHIIHLCMVEGVCA